jgi:glycosyltransferase involved in cell wall biosynthesis
MTNSLLLSILIPSYCYPMGVEKILTTLAEGNDCRVECIISDDSPDDGVQTIFEKYRHKFSNIEYIKNSPSLGAVMNWNSLIARSHGKYVLLMHHDEFPLDATFIRDLLCLINNNKEADIVLLKCYLVDEKNRKYLHAFNFLKAVVVKYFLPFILTKNIIGPTSVIVFNKNLSESFDDNLTWFVDSDFYYRILRKSNKIIFGKIGIGSELNRIQSITHGLKNNIDSIRRKEMSYMAKKYINHDFWIKYRFANFYFIVLFFLWISTRFFGRLMKAVRFF